MAGWDQVGATNTITLQAGAPAVGNARVAICVPHRSEDDNRMWSRWFTREFVMPEGSSFLEQRGFSLTTNRTRLVQLALEGGCTHVFFLDDDVLCPNNIIIDLLRLNLPIACGIYRAKKRKEERGLAAWMKVRDAAGLEGYLPIEEKQDGRIVEVDVTGLGCALIRRDIFEKVPEPWFVWEPPPAVSEDFYFFEKVGAQLGIKPVIDMQQQCGHIGVFVMGCDDTFTTPNL